MDWLVVAFIAGLAILFAIAIGQSMGRGRELDEIREITTGVGVFGPRRRRPARRRRW